MLDPGKLVFVDETGASTKMARRYGRARRGQRLVAAVPHGHWKTTTFVAALRCDRIDAPMVVDQAMNGVIFKTWVERCLAPTLSPGDIVIMDNLPAHKVKGARDAIEAKGADLVFLPPYSPDFNPIEQVFAKLKAGLRKAAERSVDGLWQRIGVCLDHFPPAECSGRACPSPLSYFAGLMMRESPIGRFDEVASDLVARRDATKSLSLAFER